MYSEDDGKRGEKKTLRIIVGKLQEKVKFWGHQVSTTTSTPTDYTVGMPEKGFPVC